MANAAKVIIIEDDVKTAAALERGLQLEGFDVGVQHDGQAGLDELNKQSFDLLILDWMLPGKDGIEILDVLRGSINAPPVLLLTARDAIEDRVRGLNCGADDYLVKPFAFAELLARVRALLRRTSDAPETENKIGDLVINLVSRQVWRSGEELFLTPREFDLLAYLVARKGQVVTRQMLVADVWREANRYSSLDNVIDVHLARLRKKVDGEGKEKLIETVRGVGFIMKELSLL